MGVIRRVTVRDRAEVVARRAATYVTRLDNALGVASRRAIRSSSTIRSLFASAKVEDRALPSGIKSTVITFMTELPNNEMQRTKLG